MPRAGPECALPGARAGRTYNGMGGPDDLTTVMVLEKKRTVEAARRREGLMAKTVGRLKFGNWGPPQSREITAERLP